MPKVPYTDEDRDLVQPALGRRIQQLRETVGLTRTELGEQVFRSRQFILLIERGGTLISLPLLIRLCQIFDLTPNELLDWDSREGGA